MIQKIGARLNSIVDDTPRRRYLILFLFDLLLRLPVILLVLANPSRAVPMGDPPGYYQLALNLAEHGVYSQGTGVPYLPEANRTPGYPLFLDLVFQVSGPSVVAVAIAQSLLHALVGVMIARLGERNFGSVRIGMGGALFWAIAPIPSVFSGILFTEILFTSVFLLLLLLLTDPPLRRAAVAGGVLGIGILIRPIAILVWPALLPFFFLGSGWRRWVARYAVFSLILVAVVSPWIYRNTVVFGKPIVSSIQGNNLLYYNAAGYIARRDGLTLRESQELAIQEYQAYLLEKKLQPATPMEESDAMSATAIRILSADPIRALWFNWLDSLNGFRPGVSYLFMFLAPDSLTPNDTTGAELSPAVSNLDRPEILLTAVLLSVFYGFLFLLAAAGIVSLVRKRNWKVLTLFGIPCFFLMYSPGLASNARFRIPVEPLLCLLAAAALSEILPLIITRFRRKIPLTNKSFSV